MTTTDPWDYLKRLERILWLLNPIAAKAALECAARCQTMVESITAAYKAAATKEEKQAIGSMSKTFRMSYARWVIKEYRRLKWVTPTEPHVNLLLVQKEILDVLIDMATDLCEQRFGSDFNEK